MLSSVFCFYLRSDSRIFPTSRYIFSVDFNLVINFFVFLASFTRFSNWNLNQQISDLVVLDFFEVRKLFFAFWARAKCFGSYLTDGTEPFSFIILSFKALVAGNGRSRYLILTLVTFKIHQVASDAQMMLKIFDFFKLRVVAAL